VSFASASAAIAVLRAAERHAVDWKNGGGVTREVAIRPPGSDLDHFDWRVSIAEVHAAGPFSSFWGIDRRMAILDGCLSLSIEEGAPQRLTADTPSISFAGEATAFAQPLGARVTDLNVMTRRGRFDSRLTRAGPPQSLSRELSLGADVSVILALAKLTLNTDLGAFHAERFDALVIEGNVRHLALSFAAPSPFWLIEISACR